MSMNSRGSFMQRAEVGQLASDARAEEQHQLAAFLQRDPAPAPLGHRAHRRRAGAGAHHEQAGARVVGHQEGRAVRTDDLDLVALAQIAQVVRRDAAHRLAVVVLGDALHRERQVVVARALAFARARDRVQAHVVRLAARVDARRQDADRLALQHRERGAAEVEHDVPDVAAGAPRAVRRKLPLTVAIAGFASV